MMNESQKISLKETGRELPFAVPENYFEDSAGQIIMLTSGRHLAVRSIIRPWLYMAGMFAGILLLGNLAYSVYQRNAGRNLENYERYLLSQLDNVSLLDFYLEEFENE